MSEVQIWEADGRILVRSPYDKEFVRGAKKLGGKWKGEAKVWAFDLDATEAVRALVGECYPGDDVVVPTGSRSGTRAASGTDQRARIDELFGRMVKTLGETLDELGDVLGLEDGPENERSSSDEDF